MYAIRAGSRSRPRCVSAFPRNCAPFNLSASICRQVPRPPDANLLISDAVTRLDLASSHNPRSASGGVTATNGDIPHFMPGAAPLVVRLLADRGSRRLLGAQIFGAGRADKRLDVLATACASGATMDVLADADLAYAPPFSSALDVVTHGANALRNKLDGRMDSCSPSELGQRLEAGAVLLDVRSPGEQDQQGRLPFDGVVSIPLGQLAARAGELPRDREIVAFCKISVRGWDAAGILKGKGFSRVSVLEGGVVGWPYDLRR